MSRVQNPITGRTSGKFATAVFSKNFDKNVMRSKPIEVKNPKTDFQQAQRDAYKKVLLTISALNSAVDLGMNRISSKMAPFSYAMSKSLISAVTGEPGLRVVDYTKIIISQGPLQKLQNLVKSFNIATGILQLDWSMGAPSNINYADSRICLAVYTPANGYSYVNTNIALLEDETALVTLDKTMIDNDSVMFIFPYADKSFIDQANPRPKKFAAGTQLATKVK